MTPRLQMRGIDKSFGATRALAGVDLEVAPAEVHALIGENGAGKSTLMKVLSGAHRADTGTLLIDGEPYAPRNPLDARRRGVAMIYQELTLVPHLTVAQNVVLGAEPGRWGWLNRREAADCARRVLSDLRRTDIGLDLPAARLSTADQQIVEIARGLLYAPRVMVMDEPTSSLGPADVEALFNVIRQLRALGVSVIYISHFLEECAAICDRYTVLRDGATVARGSMHANASPSIIAAMTGRGIEDIYPPRHPHTGDPVLEVQGVNPHGAQGDTGFTVRAGEILGVAGLVGAGRSEMLRQVFGLDRSQVRLVKVHGRAQRSRPRDSIRRGLGLLSEDRKRDGLLSTRSVADNLTYTRFRPVSRGGLILTQLQNRVGRALMERMGIRAQHPQQPVNALSGGNQQKVALGRLVHQDAEVLLLDEPTRGIDVGSKVEIYRLLAELADAGKAIVFVSSYLPELLGMCDRVMVMRRGALAALRPAGEWDEHSLMQACTGVEAVE